MFTNGPSLADIAAVTGGNRDNGGFGGDGWWAIIILLALFGGFGNRGFGGFGGAGGGCCGDGCATQADVRAAVDQQTLISKMDQQTYGIADLGYAIQGQVHGVTDAVTQTGFGLQNAITSAAFANQTGMNQLSRELAECCCENRAALAQVRYDMATQNCELGHRIDAVGDRIAGEITAYRMEQKNERIAELTQQLNAANLAASQVAQNQYLVSQLKPCPTPAYVVPNPNCCYGTQTVGCGTVGF